MRKNRLLIIGLLAVSFGAIAWWSGENLLGPAAVVPANLDAVDPDLARAIRRSAAAVDRFRGARAPRLELARVYEANGLEGHAVQTYRQIIESGEADADCWYRLACNLQGNGDLAEAIDAGNISVELDDDVAWTRWRLAMWLLDAGKFDAAEGHIDRAAELDPDDPAVDFARVRLLLLQRRPELAVSIIEGRNLIDPRVGREYGHKLRDYGRALLADAHRLQGSIEHADEQLARIRDATPSFHDPSLNEVLRHRTGTAVIRKRGEQLVVSRDYRRALELLQPLLERDVGTDIQLWNLVAICHIELGDTARGFELLEDVLAQDPDSYQSRVNITEAHLRVTKDRDTLRRVALEHANKAVERRPRHGPAWSLRARVYAKLLDHDQAALGFKKAFELDARDTKNLVEAGWSELHAGAQEDATMTFRKALEFDEAHADAHAGLAITLAAAGEVDEARRHFASAQSLGNGRPNRLAAARRAVIQAGGDRP